MKRTLLFCAGLVVAVPLCLVAWGYVLPPYGRALAQASRFLLVHVFGQAIDAVDLRPEGLFNTRTRLGFTLGARHPVMDVGALVFNIPPFVALMAITPGLPWRRRVKALAIGLSILAAGHVAYVVLAFLFAARIAASPQIPLALGELFLTLPFLLWIVLGYWDHLAGVVRNR